MTSPVLPNASRSLYSALLAQAAAAGDDMLSGVLVVARRTLREEAQRMQAVLERDRLALSVKLLDLHAPKLCAAYPKALELAFHRYDSPETRLDVATVPVLRLDQLELMDEAQVQERVETARALQQMLLVAQSALTEFNTFVCALQGLKQVTASRNPMRPDVYLLVLQELMTELGMPAPVRTAWVKHVSGGLGETLRAAYVGWTAQLQGQGVQPAVYSVLRAAVASAPQSVTGNREERTPWSPQHRQTVLTLARLRRLMAGELEATPSNAKAVFERQFAQEFESTADKLPRDTNFEPTVPAALEALQEMKQVDQVLQRMAQRPAGLLADAGLAQGGGPSVGQIMGQPQSMAQILSLEVVALMVDNLLQDARMLAPVRDIIAQLEPALLRLVLVDARFFTDRQHPARRLLQEIAQRSLAFGSADDAHFNAFQLALQRFVSPLATQQIDSAEPFALALKNLESAWAQASAHANISSHIKSAVTALEFVEARNLLADKMVAGMQSIDELQRVPQSLVDFLLGPWAQVLACAQLKDRAHLDDPGGYKALVTSLLWSAQPELTRKNIDKLTKLVPRLLSSLREGLRLIDYPSIKTSMFFDALMQLHQQAFRPVSSKPAVAKYAGLPTSLVGDQAHWVAPAEAKASGFMVFPDEEPAQPELVTPPRATYSPEVSASHGQLDGLTVGVWVELQAKDTLTRTQLSWISPQRSMFLFTSVQGKTQSMTQRMLARLYDSGLLRVMSDQSIVDSALDAVVHTAMLNSLDISAE